MIFPFFLGQKSNTGLELSSNIDYFVSLFSLTRDFGQQILIQCKSINHNIKKKNTNKILTQIPNRFIRTQK